MTAGSLLTFWYFHLPNFVLAALMYTLLGRAMLGLFVEPDSPNYIWRFFCRITDPVVAAVSAGDAEGRGAGRGLAVRRRLAVLAARGAALSVPVDGRSPRRGAEHAMERNFYFIGIAFFGMVNGLFNQVALLFALIHVQVLAPALLFGSTSLTLMFSSLMVSTATIILGGIPAAIYERYVGAKDDSTDGFALDMAGRDRRSSPCSSMGAFLSVGL